MSGRREIKWKRENKSVEGRAGRRGDQDGDSDDYEGNNVIRGKTHQDRTFNRSSQDDDSDSDLEAEASSQSSYRKRKQDISFNQDYDDETGNSDDPKSSKKRPLPLYLLNPDDFAHDPKKRMKIRRAINTNMYHERKKDQIIQLTEENWELRRYIKTLKEKMLELSHCGCEKNRYAKLDILEKKIPPVPPRVFIRGNKAALAEPYRNLSVSPTDFMSNSNDSDDFKVDAYPNSNGRKSNDKMTSGKSKPSSSYSPPTKSKANSQKVKTSPSTKGNDANNASTSVITSNFNQSTVPNLTNTPSKINLMENASFTSTPPQRTMNYNGNLSSNLSPPSHGNGLNGPLVNGTSSSSVVPPNYIIRGNYAFEPAQLEAASQLVKLRHGSDPKPIMPPTPKPTPNPPIHNPPAPVEVPSPSSSQPSQVFHAVSGQILRLVPMSSLPAVSAQVQVPPMPYFKPIKPKEAEINPDSSRKLEEEMWKRFEEGDGEEDEDKMELVITAVTGSGSTAPVEEDQNASIEHESKAMKTGESEVELNKCADTGFEEGS